MATHCFIPVLGKRIRVTRLDNCGNVPAALTANSYIVTDGFVTVSLTSEVEEGTEILKRNASGALCVNERLDSSFKRFNVEIAFCGVNPSLMAMLTNADEYLDYANDVAGFTVPEGQISKAFALELWTGLAGQACAGATEASGYVLLPYVKAGILGDFEVGGEDAVNFSLTGAYTKGGNTWLEGPYDVLANTGGAAEVQTATITGTPTGGTFTLTFNGQTTAAIAYNATAATVQTALLLLTNLDTGDVVVTGGPGPGTPYVFTFAGAYYRENVPQMTAAGSFTGGTTPAIAVVTNTQGTAGSPSPLPTALDPLDHLLLIDTSIAPPPSACSPQAMPA